MSEMKAFSATIHRAPQYCNSGTTQQQLEMLESRGHVFEDETYSETCMLVDGQWWEVVTMTDLDPNEFLITSKQDDTVSITALYYNGGCHRSELVEQAIKQNSVVEESTTNGT